MAKDKVDGRNDVGAIKDMIGTRQVSILSALMRVESSQRVAGMSAMAAIVQGCDKLVLALEGKYESPKRKGKGGGKD